MRSCSLLWTCPPWRNLPLIQWLEKNGYTVEYASNYDVHAIPDLLSHYRMFMNDAHDEYWSWPMRDQVEGFIARGGNAMFFSSNTSYWQVRYREQRPHHGRFQERVSERSDHEGRRSEQ